MKAFISLAVVATSLVETIVAVPTALQARASSINDGVILNYALTLEHLEDNFYLTGLKKFSKQDFAKAGYDATFYRNLKEVAFDEKTHVSFLTGALKAAGVTPVKECTYDFGVTSVQSFVATASILEGVGITAYLGAAASIANKDYLTAAGSILTVESRHSSYIRAGLKESPFSQPFDAPLDFDEVFTLAAPFIKSCPKDSPALPFKAFPSLTLASKTPAVKTNSEIVLTVKNALPNKKGEHLYACWIAVTGPTCEKVWVSKDRKSVKAIVPAGFHGQSYVVLTNCNNKVTDSTTVAGPAVVEVNGTSGHP